MTKEYLVTGSYLDKQTGKMVSSIVPVNGGISKAGQPYEIADLNSRETIEGQYKVGTRLTASMTLTVATAGDMPSESRSVKLGSKE